MAAIVTGKRRPVRPDSLHVVRGQQTRRRILDAARMAILRDGYQNLRLEAIARDVGVTKAAVIKSLGSKASILLELGDEDRRQRIELIRDAVRLRSALPRRLADVALRALRMDVPRLNVVMPYLGHMWFWTGEDHARAQAMLDETRVHLRELVVSASRTPLSAARTDIIALRVMSGYAVALRDVYYGQATVEQAARLVKDHALDPR
jgi:AcrR family transcriptional regulator